MYIRYMKKDGTLKLLEVRGMPYFTEADKEIYISLAARHYRCKSSQSMDHILELQVETLQLKSRLAFDLEKKGM